MNGKEQQKMKAIILAAGQGTRLKKYTENLPKGMLSFMGETIIERQVKTYRRCGIDDIVVVRGFAADKIAYQGVKYYDNADFANTNMVESLLAAKAEFTDDVVVSYSDILFEERLLKGMMEAKGDFLVGVDDNWQAYWLKRYGKVDFDTESLAIDADDDIVELGLPDPRLESISARYIGLLKFSKAGLCHVQKIMDDAHANFADRPWQQSGKTAYKAYMTDLLNAVIQSGRPVKAVHFENGWIEFDTNEDYESACEWARDGSIGQFLKI